MRALIYITSPSSAMMSPHIVKLFPYIRASRLGELATPTAVTPVITSARVIHTYTLRMRAENTLESATSC